ncbi:MAG: cell division protein FtsA [Azospirillaceae bacterium]|nr:cell division protein FtsA [Azospirillaceae bacterium]
MTLDKVDPVRNSVNATMSNSGTRRPKWFARSGIVAALDVGTSKVSCLIGRADEQGRFKIIGAGHQLARGIKAGAIIDMEQAEAAIGTAVHAAEQMAGETIRSVIVNLTGGQPRSRNVQVEIAIGGNPVGDAEVRKALAQARQVQIGPDAELIHSIPVSYSIDNTRGIHDPRGMFGDRLGIQLNLVAAATGPVRNLATCIARCHLDIESIVASPYAAALAALVDDEMDLGCTLIDMGGGTTSIAGFLDGGLAFTDCVPVGGSHVTNDIARGLTTAVVHAERIKTLHGSAMASSADERETIMVPQIGEEGPGQAAQVQKSQLVSIIQPRMEEIFELVRDRLEASGFAKSLGRRVILTGGASQLPGTRELAQAILDKQVRLGRPLNLTGDIGASAGPAYATVAGLLAYAIQHRPEVPTAVQTDSSPGWLRRVGRWIKENI